MAKLNTQGKKMKNYEGPLQNWKRLLKLSTLAVIILIALCLQSCSRRALPTSSSTTAIFDSEVTVETLRDTVVTVKADSALIRALIECDSLGQAHIRQLVEYRAGERLRPPKIDIKDNVLTAAAQVDSMAIYLQLKDRLQVREHNKSEIKVIHQTVETNRLTWWQKWLLWIGVFYLGRTALRLAFNWQSITLKSLFKFLI